MTTKIPSLQSVFLILFLSAISFGQNDLDSNKIRSLKQKQVKLDIALKEKVVKLENPILLNTSIQNNFSREISTLPFYIDEPLGFYVVEITNSQGELQKRTDAPKAPRFGSRTALHLMSGEKFSYDLQLNRSFNLTVGKYSVTTSFIVFDVVKREKVIINSNTETLRV